MKRRCQVRRLHALRRLRILSLVASVYATSDCQRLHFQEGRVEGLGSSIEEEGQAGLNRSQSYSAFSELRRMSSTFSNRSGESSGLASVDESEKFRGYFCKFVDLVIVREMTALASLQLHEARTL